MGSLAGIGSQRIGLQCHRRGSGCPVTGIPVLGEQHGWTGRSFALSLSESRLGTGPMGRAVALFVQRSIASWRGSPKRITHAVADRSRFPPTGQHVTTKPSDPWELARRNFPHVDDETGIVATRMLHESGIELLSRARKPWDQVISVAILRFAARRLRGETLGCDVDESASPVADILAVQRYSEASGFIPLLVGYCGPGRPVDQARALLRDSRTLRDAVTTPNDTGAAVWQMAIDFHSFSMVALNHRFLLGLPVDDAIEIAAASLRLAAASIETPGVVELPVMPTGSALSPEQVRFHARAYLRQTATKKTPQLPHHLGIRRAKLTSAYGRKVPSLAGVGVTRGRKCRRGRRRASIAYVPPVTAVSRRLQRLHAVLREWPAAGV